MTDDLDPQAPADLESDAREGADLVEIRLDVLVEPEPDRSSGLSDIFGPFFNAIVAPKERWEGLDAKPILSIWIAVWIAVVSTGFAIYNLPIMQRVMIDSIRVSARAQGSEFAPGELQQMQDLMMMGSTVVIYLSGIFVLIWLVITALAIWFLGASMGSSAVTFGRAFGVAAAAEVIRSLIYNTYVTVILNINPPEIRRPEDAATVTPTLGLDLAFSGPNTPVWMHTILARIDLFVLWQAALIAFGCVGVMKLSKGQGITVATILWLFGTVFAVGAAWLGSLGF